MRHEPACDRVDQRADDRCACRGRREAKQDRTPEGIVELLDGDAIEAAVEPFHYRNGECGAGNDAPDEGQRLSEPAARLGKPSTIERRYRAAGPYPPSREQEGEEDREAADDVPRRVRQVVICVVGERVISHQIDCHVRHRGRARGRA